MPRTEQLPGGQLTASTLHEPWFDYAACRGLARSEGNFDTFFPKQEQVSGLAAKLCTTCLVRNQCLDFAIANGIKEGVWGGKGRLERKRIAKLRAKSAPEMVADIGDVVDSIAASLDV